MSQFARLRGLPFDNEPMTAVKHDPHCFDVMFLEHIVVTKARRQYAEERALPEWEQPVIGGEG